MHVQSITEEWKNMSKRNGNARLITIDGYQVLKENNYSLEQVCLPAPAPHPDTNDLNASARRQMKLLCDCLYLAPEAL